jgi:hypothetical protein
MLVVVLAAALTPNFGSVAAQSSCPYGNCTSGSGSAFPWTWLFVGLAIIIAAIILALLLISRRRRNPPASTQPWVPGGAGSTGGAPGGPGGAGSPPSTGTSGVGAAGGTSPAYVETASDVGTVPATAAVAGAGAAGGAAAGYAEGSAAGGGDIDSLMAELEKISGEILKKGQSPKKGNGDSAEGTAEAGTSED